jgi:hypothetical protein
MTGMQGIDESSGTTAAVHCSAVKSGIDLITIGALPGQIVADLKIGDQHSIGFFKMASASPMLSLWPCVSSTCVTPSAGSSHPFQDGLSDRNGSIRISATDLDAKSGMAVPRQFHWSVSSAMLQ